MDALRLARLAVAATVLAGAAAAVRGEPGRVLSLIGDAACASDSDCATIGVGAKACGGPAAYVAWSRLRTDPAALEAAVQADAAAPPRAGDSAPSMSTCTVVRDPGAWCDRRASRGAAANGTCRLNGPVGGTVPHTTPGVR